MSISLGHSVNTPEALTAQKQCGYFIQFVTQPLLYSFRFFFKRRNMTPSIPTPKTVRPATKRFVTPAINLDRPARKTLNKDDCLTFKLRSVPTDETSTTYELTVGYFKTGTAEELLLFLQNVRKIFSGQNVTNGPNRYAIVRRLLQGDALAAFNRAATQHGTETVEHF